MKQEIDDGKGTWRNKYVKFLPPLTVLVLLFIVISLSRGISLDGVLACEPKALTIAALTVICIYGVKTALVFFPVMAIYIGVSLMFPPILAIVVNMCGLILSTTLSYWTGKVWGQGLVQRLSVRYEKVSELTGFGEDNSVFLSFATRMVSVLPIDVVSMVLGASGIKYSAFMTGSLLGMLPHMVLIVLMGDSINDPLSWNFIVPLTVKVLISVGSFWLYRRYQRR